MSNFKNILNSDPEIARRWAIVIEKLTELARSAFNVELTEADLFAIPEARIHAVNGDEMDLDRAMDEVRNLDRTKGLLEEQRRAAAIKAGDDSELEKLGRMGRAERMSEARRIGLDDLSTPREASSIEDTDVLLRRAMSLSPARRIAFARQHGLLS